MAGYDLFMFSFAMYVGFRHTRDVRVLDEVKGGMRHLGRQSSSIMKVILMDTVRYYILCGLIYFCGGLFLTTDKADHAERDQLHGMARFDRSFGSSSYLCAQRRT